MNRFAALLDRLAYEDGEGWHFMEPETFEQLTVGEDVIGDGKVRFGTAQMPSCLAHRNERLRAGDFVDDVAVYIEQRFTSTQIGDDVRIPQLFVERFGLHSLGTPAST